MTSTPDGTAIKFSDLLADEENRKTFIAAVHQATLLQFGSHGGPYNIDKMAYFVAASECHLYAREHMRDLPRFPNREALLHFALGLAPSEGMILEFGVATAHTTNLIAEQVPERRVYGFDGFQGLPENWTPSTPEGTFARDALPEVRGNVELVVGYFDRTLVPFLDTHPEAVSFLHCDCDLYSSTQTVLMALKNRIRPGTIIVFDEYFNYPDWRRHEHAAFMEFIAHTGKRFEYIGLVPMFEQVAVRITG
jgi:predicted O-methyltransferase YrrM